MIFVDELVVGNLPRPSNSYTNDYSGDSTELTYLRSRFYEGGTGRFLTRDTWSGNANEPLSLNKWGYVEGNPINLTDPSGKNPAEGGNYPRHCQSMPTKAQYESCVLEFFGLKPINPNQMGETVKGVTGCYIGPEEYRAPGYTEGIGGSATIWAGGVEVVYDFATMQRQVFTYTGWGFNFSNVGISGSQYAGVVDGLKNSFISDRYDLNDDYRGLSHSVTLGLSIGEGGSINGGVNIFWSDADPLIRGISTYFGGGAGISIIPIVDIAVYNLDYHPRSNVPFNYVQSNGIVDAGSLMNDILSGKDSPLLWFGGLSPQATYSTRSYEATKAFKYVYAHNALRFQEILGW